MTMNWIDYYVNGLKEIVDSEDVYIILSFLDIELIKLDKNSNLLKNREAFYSRNFNNTETVFIRNDLDREYEKFLIAHEIGHAILHTKVKEAAYKNTINDDKYECHADYFAVKLLDKSIDPAYFEGYTADSIAKSLHISKGAVEYVIRKLS